MLELSVYYQTGHRQHAENILDTPRVHTKRLRANTRSASRTPSAGVDLPEVHAFRKVARRGLFNEVVYVEYWR